MCKIKLETKRLILRPFMMDDLIDVNEYCSLPNVGINAGWAKHTSIKETKIVLEDWIKYDEKYAIIYKENNKIIGHISIDPDSEEQREDTRELGFVLHEAYQRQGIMFEALSVILDYLFTKDINYIWACCFQNNLASKKLIEKLGFEFMQEGEFYSESLDKDFDSFEYRITKNEWKCLKTNN